MTSKISALLRFGSPAILVSVGNATSRSDGAMQSGYKIPNDPRRDVGASTPAAAAAPGDFSYLEKWKAWAYAEPTDPALRAAFDQFCMDQTGGGWDRVDDMAFRRAGSPGDGSAAIAASLGVKAGAIPAYRMYVRRDAGEVALVAQLASGATGHPSILHGGITALLFDEGMGWMTAAYRLKEHGVLGALNDVNFEGATDIRKKSVRTGCYIVFVYSWAVNIFSCASMMLTSDSRS